MYTQCPNCQQKHPVTVEQLRTTRAIVHCSHCAIEFDALEQLHESMLERQVEVHLADELPAKAKFPQTVEQAEKVKAEDEALPELPWEKPAQAGKSYWTGGSILAVLVLIGQGIFFEGEHLSQDPEIRHYLDAACAVLKCQLPAYINLDELSILHSEFEPLPANQGYNFRLVIANQAVFPQPYPNIKLTLLDYTGRPFSQRTLQAKDYLTTKAPPIMAADATVDVNLNIAATETPIGGHTTEFTR